MRSLQIKSELLKIESSATNGGSSMYTEKASVKMVSFPCGGHILYPSQKRSGNLSDWLRHYFPKTVQIGLPISHWCLLPNKAKKILSKETLSSVCHHLRCKLIPPFCPLPIYATWNNAWNLPHPHMQQTQNSCTKEVVIVRQNLGHGTCDNQHCSLVINIRVF